MNLLSSLSRAIDALVYTIGRAVIWLTLVVVLISAGNAVIRKTFHVSSNAWLEIQWYLFGAIFLLAAGYTFMKNEHVRVDIISQMMSKRTQILIEIFGVLFFMLPACLLMLDLSIPFFMQSFLTNEQSSNAGGLIRWPVKLLIPIGFFLLVLAGVSHLIKCAAFLAGKGPDPLATVQGKTAEQLLAEEIANEARLKEMEQRTDK